MFSPKTEALAFRLCVWAGEREWNCTLSEAAEALGVSVQSVSQVAKVKGWLRRFRAGEREIARCHKMDGRREIDGIPMIGLDGLEALGVHYGV